MNGLEKLEKEVLEMDDPSVTKIFEYLKTRKDLYEKFNNKEKSIKQMYKYICDKAQTKAKSHVAVVEDNLVYLWAVTYFNRSNEELGIKKEKAMPPSAKDVIGKIDKEQAKKSEEQTKKQDTQISMFEEVQ